MENKKIKSAGIWSIIETISATTLGLLSILVLAKIIGPTEYGKIALVQAISGVIQIILSLGLNELIIQKKDLKGNDLQTFWSVTLIMAVVGLSICMLIGFILIKFDMGDIGYIMMCESIITFFILLAIVPTAILMRDLRMKSFAIRNIFTRLLFFLVAIPLALNNFGVWSIVYAMMVQIICTFILIFIETKNRFNKSIKIDFFIVKNEMKFGYYVMIENFLWSFLTKILGILLGVFHGTQAVGLYNMASRLLDTIANVLNTAITRLALPIFSDKQDDKLGLLKSFQISTYYFNMLSMPTFIFIGITANLWVPIILGEIWIDMIPILQILSVMYAIMNTRLFVGIVMKAIGRSKDFLKLSILSAIVTVLSLLITYDRGLILSLTILVFFRFIITVPYGVYLMYKICSYNINEQFKYTVRPVVLTFIICLFVFLFEGMFDIGLKYGFLFNIFIFLFVFILFFIILGKKKMFLIGGDRD